MESKRIGTTGEYVWLDGLAIKRGSKTDMVGNGGIVVAWLESWPDGLPWGVWGLAGRSWSPTGALAAYARAMARRGEWGEWREGGDPRIVCGSCTRRM